MTAPLLELSRISKRFERIVAADALSLVIDRGEFFTFLGPSGSGKSTILRIIAGLDRPDDGRVLIDGRDMAGVPPWRRHVGMVFQQYALFPHMTVAQNVGYGLRVRGGAGADVGRRVAELLELVGLVAMRDKNVTLLSGGEQQRVAVARGLATAPALLLLDEPLAALDEKIRREMQTELKHIQRRTGAAFLYVTHDQEEALTMSDRIAVLNRGVCVQCDQPEALFRRPHSRFVARFFRGCNVLEAELLGCAGDDATIRLGGMPLAVPRRGIPIPAGGSVGVAVRAENLRLGIAAAGAPIQLAATLVEAIYRGTTVDHVMVLPDGQRVVATATQRAVDTPGPLPLGLSPDDVILLAD